MKTKSKRFSFFYFILALEQSIEKQSSGLFCMTQCESEAEHTVVPDRTLPCSPGFGWKVLTTLFFTRCPLHPHQVKTKSNRFSFFYFILALEQSVKKTIQWIVFRTRRERESIENIEAEHTVVLTEHFRVLPAFG